jgi:hypothetical protein
MVKLKMMKLDELKRIAAENGISSSGTQDVLLKNLEKYLELHGKFKRDLK